MHLREKQIAESPTKPTMPHAIKMGFLNSLNLMNLSNVAWVGWGVLNPVTAILNKMSISSSLKLIQNPVGG